MKTLKNVVFFIELVCNFVFADYVCIYNKTGDNLKVMKVTTGNLNFDLFRLNDSGLREFKQTLQDTDCLERNIRAGDGILIELSYGYKKSSRTPSIELIGKNNARIYIDLTIHDGVSPQGCYSVSQRYNESLDSSRADPKMSKWWFACDKMVIVSDEN